MVWMRRGVEKEKRWIRMGLRTEVQSDGKDDRRSIIEGVIV
jgi:hypothetical protein